MKGARCARRPLRAHASVQPPPLSLCQRCEKNVASVHVVDVESFVSFRHTDNEVVSQSLCESCAQEDSLPFSHPITKQLPPGLWDMLNMKAKEAAAPLPKRQVKTCSECGMTVDQFRRKGRLGCGHCYETFALELKEVLERIHGAHKHTGRTPGVDPRLAEMKRRRANLERDLEDAVAQEAYERAAGIRDELKRLETDLG